MVVLNGALLFAITEMVMAMLTDPIGISVFDRGDLCVEFVEVLHQRVYMQRIYCTGIRF